MEKVTGVVLAGGRGERMGGLDKGLQPFLGERLVDHAVKRLRPQVDQLLVVANRNLQTYAGLGYPVINDAHAESASFAPHVSSPSIFPLSHDDFKGPLAGLLAGMVACRTPWLVTVPCDSPFFPSDLVERLQGAAMEEESSLVVAATEGLSGLLFQPVFLLAHACMQKSLRQFLAAGYRSPRDWLTQQKASRVVFHEPDAFLNANSLKDLDQLTQQRTGRL
jgi:molybdopterin-guanine dinucleotide biosynthesis protein A